MSEIWTKTPGTVCASNRVAVQASRRFEDMSSSRFFFILIRRLSLRADPGSKLFGVVHVNAQEHLCVLRSAILSALAEKQARFMRVYPCLVYVVRNQVGFSRKLGNPETVVGIGGKQFQECGRGVCGVTQGDV